MVGTYTSDETMQEISDPGRDIGGGEAWATDLTFSTNTRMVRSQKSKGSVFFASGRPELMFRRPDLPILHRMLFRTRQPRRH
jgi:hypothetical protein